MPAPTPARVWRPIRLPTGWIIECDHGLVRCSADNEADATTRAADLNAAEAARAASQIRESQANG